MARLRRPSCPKGTRVPWPCCWAQRQGEKEPGEGKRLASTISALEEYEFKYLCLRISSFLVRHPLSFTPAERMHLVEVVPGRGRRISGNHIAPLRRNARTREELGEWFVARIAEARWRNSPKHHIDRPCGGHLARRLLRHSIDLQTAWNF